VRQTRLDEYITLLLAVLDEDAAHIRRTLEHLNALRAAVIKRDEAALQELLDTVARQGENYRHIEARRQRLCDEIAETAGGDIAPVNLSGLCEIAGRHLHLAIRTRQEELKDLVRTLRMEHACTMILLRECSRLNRTLLKAVLGRGGETVTYTARGSETWQPQNDFVDMKL
jgi:hypothetical protein